MEYKKLGRTNLQVSVIGMGGEWLNKCTQEEVNTIFDTAIANNVNYLDIFMPQPETRSLIGNALKNRREKMYIQGHLCTTMKDGQYERTRDLEEIKTSFNDLLTRLHTDYIDVGMIHYVDTLEDFNSVFNTQIIEYALDLKKKKIIHHLGLSSHNPLIALKALQTGLIDVLMFSINPAYDLEKSDTDIYNLIDFKDLERDNWSIDPARQELYGYCQENSIGITVMKALGAGSLLSAESSPFNKAMTVTQCCYYCLTRPAVASVLIGYKSNEELLDALKYLKASKEEKDYTHILSSNANVKLTGKCMYCNHCLPCPSHIDIAEVTKFMDLALMQDTVSETVKSHYLALEHTAKDCIQCGECESNCPFSVEIRKNMEKALTLFKT